MFSSRGASLPTSVAAYRREWREWQETNLAQELLQQEQKLIAPILTRKFGQHLLQVSMAGAEPLYQDSPIVNKALVHFEYPVEGLGHALVSRPEQLAVGNEQVDLVILHHVLEFSEHPHQVLREAQRILVSGGQVVIVGFNPWSCWRLRQLMTPRRYGPWSGRYISDSRLSDWLRLLDFAIEDTDFGFFKLPLGNRQLLQRQNALERWGRRYNLMLGASYVMLARKQVAGLMPLQEEPKQRKPILAFPVTEPTARGMRNNKHGA